MPYFKATIEVLVDVEDENAACDCISETMRPLLHNFCPGSAMIDWRYADSSILPTPDDGGSFEYADIREANAHAAADACAKPTVDASGANHG